MYIKRYLSLYQFWYRRRLRLFALGVATLIAIQEAVLIFVRPNIALPPLMFFALLYAAYLGCLFVSSRALVLTKKYVSAFGLKTEKNPLMRFLLSRKWNTLYFAGIILALIFFAMELLGSEASVLLGAFTVLGILSLDLLNDFLLTRYKRVRIKSELQPRTQAQ